MASSDWLDIRGLVENIVGWSMDSTHDIMPKEIDLQFTISPPEGIWPSDIVIGSILRPQDGFSNIQPALEGFFSTSIICTIVFVTMMLALLPITYIERKLGARLMDRVGCTTALRSLWVGESGVTAGNWWDKLPFGLGAPVGWLNRFLNSIWGNEHKLDTVSRVNNRSWHGYWFLLPGIVNSFADFTKFAGKEHIVPKNADRAVFEIAPIIIISTTVLVFAFIPFGPHYYASNPDLSVIFMMAVFGVAPLGVFFAGWASNNKYTLIGGMRSAAQLTAYEIPLLITVLGVCVISGSFNIIEIVDFQYDSGIWNIFLMPLGAALFLITMIAEVERIPFDMPEAEAELVEGWWTEYGGIRWGLMFAAEYMRSFAACVLFALFFLGGWEAPFQTILESIPIIGGIVEFGFSLIPGIVWIIIKSYVLFSFFVWIRFSLHRVRTDQILEFGWQWLLPLSIVNLALAFILRIELWDNGWNLLAPISMTALGILGFIILAVDEDKEAIEEMRRPYNSRTIVKASPGSQKKIDNDAIKKAYSVYTGTISTPSSGGLTDKELIQ